MNQFVRVGCYVRVSTENQLENYSIEEQISRLKSFCAAKDWTIYKFYTDGGYSGGNLNRPALMKLIDDVKGGVLDMVVVYKLDRLSRSQKDTLMLIEDEFIAHNVEFVSMSENFDTSTPFGRATIGMLSVFAQLEKDQITERFTMGRIGRSKAGYYHGGSIAPTGYDYVNGKLVVNEYMAAQVQEAFDLFVSGYSLNAIHNQLHDKYGGWSSHTMLINVIRNSVYIGKVKFKGKEYDGIHQPIIAKDVYFKAQQLLNSSAREQGKTTAQKTPFRAGYLLSSLVFCARCGARYSANHGYYKCYSRSKSSKRFIKNPDCKNENWLIEDLDSAVIDEVRKIAYDKEYFDKMVEPYESIPGKADKGKSKKRIKEIDAQISRMIDLYQVGTISMGDISKRVDALEKERTSLEATLQDSSFQVKKNELLNRLSEFNDSFDSWNLEKKRLFIGGIVESVWVDGNSINLRLRVL